MPHKKLSGKAPCPGSSGRKYEACCWDQGVACVAERMRKSLARSAVLTSHRRLRGRTWSATLCMGQAACHVRQPPEEDRLGLMVMVRLEDILVPRLGRLPGMGRFAELQELMQGLPNVRRPQHRLLQIR